MGGEREKEAGYGGLRTIKSEKISRKREKEAEGKKEEGEKGNTRTVSIIP